MTDPVADLEAAVARLAAAAKADPGEYEAHLPRIAAADFALLDIRAEVAETCNAVRRDAVFKATARMLEHTT